jgi:hypothetical protein
MQWHWHASAINSPLVPTFRHQIKYDDLQARAGKDKMCKFAFAQLVLRKDCTLWNRRKTINDVVVADFALPTKNKIAAELERLNGQPTLEDK